MSEAAVIIPNWNGMKYLPGCLDSLQRQRFTDFSVYLVDNGSEDGSADYVQTHYPHVHLIRLSENTGFCHAVNEGIRADDSPFVILLNNDTVAAPGFVGELVSAIRARSDAFACQAKMLSMHEKGVIDDAGDLYCALGWAFSRGRGKASSSCVRSDRIFSACGGACIWRRSVLEQIGLLDESHFAYLEDVDISWRAARAGFHCYFAPKAAVLHAGSASSGSKHNAFKVKLTARNSIWIIRKNMPVWQRVLNLPFLMAGFAIKMVYFARKGLCREYLQGLAEGLSPMKGRPGADGFTSANGLQRAESLTSAKGRKKTAGSLRSCLDIQAQLWINTLRRIGEKV